MHSVFASLPSLKGASLDAPVPLPTLDVRPDAPDPHPYPVVLRVSGVRKGVFWCRGTVTFSGVSLAAGYCPRIEKPWPLEVGAVVTSWQWHNTVPNDGRKEALFTTERAVSPGEVIEADYRIVFAQVTAQLRPDLRATFWQWLKRF